MKETLSFGRENERGRYAMRLRTALSWVALMLAAYLSVACHAEQASPTAMVAIPAVMRANISPRDSSFR